MTPKEKAKELVDRFKPLADWNNEYGSAEAKTNHIKAKQCALICVDEILDENSANNVSNDCAWVKDEDGKFRMTNEQFWQAVKHEINLL